MGEYKYLIITKVNGRFHKGELELKEQIQREMYSVIGTNCKYDLSVDTQPKMLNSIILTIMIYVMKVTAH